ncbi:type I secretion system permease/ATPase [Rhizobium sp. SG570]|uniref:type I secretion system permease/ATPase n=1 Tax=Rhizobium sp. SG570 TaxID=2587113 RepID=UPI001446CAD5|nr:type I secretion system permease/ATPase [Rhizobium sp. SG570]NKJ38681.1 PrtD family type I secretion system ABC transporter [Rhizobium sp. SG570]
MPFIGTLTFSGVINLLALSGPLFMLEIYDRVIPSKSVETLVALLILIATLYGFSGLLELARGRVMSRIAGVMDAKISTRVAAVIAGASLRTRMTNDILKPAQDADQIRSFLSSSGPMALFDLPWMPVYLAICFFLHPLIGWLAVGAMVVLVVITLSTDLVTRRRTRQISDAVSVRNRFGEALHRNAEAIAAMGLLSQAGAQWNEAHERSAELQRKTGDIAGLTSGLSRTIRQMVQSGALGLGAWLVIEGDLSGGAIVAGTTVLARALQPIEQVIGNWRAMVAARQSWRRLEEVFKLFPPEAERTALPAPSKSLSIEGVFAAPPGERQRMTVQNVSFRAEAGMAIGVIGPSASGKSSLVRAITGVWPHARGKICLDGAALDQWPSDLRGRHIGYMPQSSDLFPSTIALNIARLNRDASHDAIIAAAQAAGVHDMIVALPDGYETQVGDNGVNLSAGQRQRVALARALYGDPFLVVLDEPNSNLDMDGDRALAQAIAGVKARGGIVIVVAHRNSVLAQIDMLLVMENGVAKAFGSRDRVLRGLQQNQGRPRIPTAPALTVVEGESA